MRVISSIAEAVADGSTIYFKMNEGGDMLECRLIKVDGSTFAQGHSHFDENTDGIFVRGLEGLKKA